MLLAWHIKRINANTVRHILNSSGKQHANGVQVKTPKNEKLNSVKRLSNGGLQILNGGKLFGMLPTHDTATAILIGSASIEHFTNMAFRWLNTMASKAVSQLALATAAITQGRLKSTIRTQTLRRFAACCVTLVMWQLAVYGMTPTDWSVWRNTLGDSR